MKKLLLFTFFISILFNASATDFAKGKIILKNGLQQDGYVQTIYYGIERNIAFKTEETSLSEKINSDSILTIRYEDGTEFDYVRIYATGLGKYGKLGKPTWMQVAKRGFLTLYKESSTEQLPYARGVGGVMFQTGNIVFCNYYAVRKTELGLKLISSNGNFNFKFFGSRYFSDYPELVEKIKNKTYTYKNLFEVVDIYNKWIEEKANNKE